MKPITRKRKQKYVKKVKKSVDISGNKVYYIQALNESDTDEKFHPFGL